MSIYVIGPRFFLIFCYILYLYVILCFKVYSCSLLLLYFLSSRLWPLQSNHHKPQAVLLLCILWNVINLFQVISQSVVSGLSTQVPVRIIGISWPVCTAKFCIVVYEDSSTSRVFTLVSYLARDFVVTNYRIRKGKLWGNQGFTGFHQQWNLFKCMYCFIEYVHTYVRMS